MLSAFAALTRFQRVSSSMRTMASRSAAWAAFRPMSLRETRAVPAGGGAAWSVPRPAPSGKALRVSSGSPSTIMRLIMFSSSRTLPG